MSKVTPFGRSVVESLEALATEVALGTIVIGDMLAEDPHVRTYTLDRVLARLTHWHWHPSLAELLPMVRTAAVSVQTARSVAVVQPATLLRTNADARAILQKAHDDLDAFRNDLVCWVYAMKSGKTPAFTPTRPRVFQARV